MVFVRRISALCMACLCGSFLLAMDQDNSSAQSAARLLQTVRPMSIGPAAGLVMPSYHPAMLARAPASVAISPFTQVSGPFGWGGRLLGYVLPAIIAGQTADQQIEELLDMQSCDTSPAARLATAAAARVARESSKNVAGALGKVCNSILGSVASAVGANELSKVWQSSKLSQLATCVTGGNSSAQGVRLGIPLVGGLGLGGVGIYTAVASQFPVVGRIAALVAGLGVALKGMSTWWDRWHLVRVHQDHRLACEAGVLDDGSRYAVSDLVEDIIWRRFLTSYVGKVCTNGTLVFEGTASIDQKMRVVQVLAERTRVPVLVISVPELIACAQEGWAQKNVNHIIERAQSCSEVTKCAIVCLTEFEKLVPRGDSAFLFRELTEALASNTANSCYKFLFLGLLSPEARFNPEAGWSFFNTTLIVNCGVNEKLSVLHKNGFERALRAATRVPDASTAWQFFIPCPENALETFDDMVGLPAEIGDLRKSLDQWLAAVRSEDTGELAQIIMAGRAPGGIILHGPPGTGKSTLAFLLSKTYQIPMCDASAFFRVRPSSLDSFRDNLARLFDNAYNQARASQAKLAIIYVDDLSTLITNDSPADDSAHHMTEEQKGVIQSILDSPATKNQMAHIMLVITTNVDAVNFDQALTRSGRFNWKIKCSLPDDQAREVFIRNYLSKIRSELSHDAIDKIIHETANQTIPDVRNAVNRSIGHPGH